MSRLRYDNSYGTLGASQAAGDLTITFAAPLTYADGIQVPTITGGSTIDITVEPNSTNFEVERITAYTQGALTATVTRGISGSAKSHLSGVTFGHNPTAGGDFNGGTPSLALGTTNTAGTSGTPFDAASAIAVFDATVPVTQNYSDAAATGSAAVAARRDHKHGMPAISGVTWPLTNTGDETFQPNSIANNALTIHNNANAVNGVTITGTASGTNPSVTGSGGLTLTSTGASSGVSLVTPGTSGSVTMTIGGIGTYTYNGTNASIGANANTTQWSCGSSTASLQATQTLVQIYSANNGGSVVLGGVASISAAGQSAFTATGVGSGVNGVTATQATTNNSPTLLASGSDSNIDLTVGGKGAAGLKVSTAGITNGSSARIFVVTGAPSNSNGSDGDFAFRTDGGSLTTIYQHRSGSWAGIV